MLEARKQAAPKRSPRNPDLWFGGLFVCGTTKQKLAGSASMKCLRVNHPDHHEKKLTFEQAEWFIGQWLEIVGKRIKVLGEAAKSKRLLERLTASEWMAELKFDVILFDIQKHLVEKLGDGCHTVGETTVIITWDNDEGCYCFDTDGSYLDLYCDMVRDEKANNRKALMDWVEERDRLTDELMMMKDKDDYIIRKYNQRIGQLSKQIKEAADPPKYEQWWREVQEEIATIRQKQEQVKKAIAVGEPLRKAQAIRQLIDHIVVDWATEPSSDRRHKDGVRTYVKGVRVVGTDGNETAIITNETPLA